MIFKWTEQWKNLHLIGLHMFSSSLHKTVHSNTVGYSMYLQALDLKAYSQCVVLMLCGCSYILPLDCSQQWGQLLAREKPQEISPKLTQVSSAKSQSWRIGCVAFLLCSLFINYLMNHVTWQIRDVEPVCFHFYSIHFFTIHCELATLCINEKLKTEVYFIRARYTFSTQLYNMNRLWLFPHYSFIM